MKHFSEELKKIKVLQKVDLVGLRLYIKHNHPEYDQRKRAIALATSIRSIISQHLEGLPQSHQQALLKQIITGSLLTKEEGLFLSDVLETALSLDIEETDYIEGLCHWVNGHISNPIALEDMLEYQQTVKILQKETTIKEIQTPNKTEEDATPDEIKGKIVKDDLIKNEIVEDKIIENKNSDDFTVVREEVTEDKTTKDNFINLIKIEEIKEVLGVLTSKFKLIVADLRIKEVIDHIKDKCLHLNKKLQLTKQKLLLIPLLAILLAVSFFFPKEMKPKEPAVIFLDLPISYEYPVFPAVFQYRDINEDKLKAYLNSRNSILEEEPYFSAIISTAEEFQLNPLVLFAIAGHEQGFVPKDHPRATEIANNPFNVFYSWQHYNTDIVDTSRIAARTVINLSKDRPVGKDPFKWINRRYAEDQNWYKGVGAIYNRLELEVEEGPP
ncbi:glucosaminidase domain-containing protein [Alkaliphilus transvaalensis]|uniref:glucosaminidase domain-containing protein n=1 Tax=Alkaliphilus transvaalensis TaxID=114628 RepID=UPI000688E975|nr:glucosaminidase domain-containing protein [Alkaliphilus transvaalensis]